jgi:hypothetical protein
MDMYQPPPDCRPTLAHFPGPSPILELDYLTRPERKQSLAATAHRSEQALPVGSDSCPLVLEVVPEQTSRDPNGEGPTAEGVTLDHHCQKSHILQNIPRPGSIQHSPSYPHYYFA